MTNILLTSSGQVKANSRELYYETFGNPSHPAVLLIMGLASQSLQWFPYFYEPIAQKGYYVIRFDNRDIGLSDRIDPADWATHPYTLEDMAKDTIGLLDALNIKTAHIIGASMGGMIAQRIAISHPTYVRTLTSMLSAAEAGSLSFSPSLPEGIDPTQPPPLEIQLQIWKMLTSSRFSFDELLYRELYRQSFEVRKGYNPHCLTHQLTAIQLSGSRMHELSSIVAPTLVVHGTKDPIIPEAHAALYAQKIPQATYLALDGVGHEIPEGIAPKVLTAIFDLFSKAPNPSEMILPPQENKPMTDETTTIYQTFVAYSQNFNTLNPDKVAPYIHLPALLITNEQVIPMSTDVEVKGVFSKFFDRLKEGDFKESKLHTLQVKQVSQNQAIVSGTATRYTTNGSVLEHFGLTYTLRKIANDWKIVAGVLHDSEGFFTRSQ